MAVHRLSKRVVGDAEPVAAESTSDRDAARPGPTPEAPPPETSLPTWRGDDGVELQNDSAAPDETPQADEPPSEGGHVAEPSSDRGRAVIVPLNADNRTAGRGGALVVSRRQRLGEILLEAHRISPSDIDTILEEQTRTGLKFGELAIALRCSDPSDVLWALSRQSGLAYDRVDLEGGADPELVIARQAFGPAAERIRDVRSQLLSGVLSPDARPRRALAVVSAEPGEGRTFFAANLALSFAQLGRRTLLIEADLRAPRLRRLFALGDEQYSLDSVLAGEEMLRDSITHLPDLPLLHLLPAAGGSLSPLELLEQPAFSLMLSSLIAQYDSVIVDTPSASRGGDVRVVAQACGAALVLARTGRTRMDAVHALVSQLQRSGVAIAGLLMNSH